MFSTLAPARFVTATRLFNLLIIGSILGITLPLLTVGLRYCSADFYLWHEAVADNEFLGNVVDEYPILDISRSLPALSQWAWHDASNHQTYTGYYVRYCLFNTGFLILIMVFRGKVKAWMAMSVDWLYIDRDHNARRIVLAAVIIVVFSYQTKAHFGFWWPGISGWTEENLQTRLDNNSPEPGAGNIEVGLPEGAFLKKAIRAENAVYLPSAGFLDGETMFLHFQNGEVLPANYELVEFVFPLFIFGRLYEEVSDPSVFWQLVKSSLAYRNDNRRFLLPLSISYPNHAPYMRIDYRAYPPAATLEKVSFWKLTIYVDESRDIGVVRAREVYSLGLR